MSNHSIHAFSELYQSKLKNGDLQEDPEQQLVVNQMQKVYEQIEFSHQSRSGFSLNQLFSFSSDSESSEYIDI